MSRKESLNNDINNISKAIHLLLVSIFGISAWGFVNYESLGSGKISLLFIVACLLCAAEYIIIKRYKKLNKELENLWVFWYLLLLLLFFFLVFFCWFLEYKKHKSLRFLLLVKYPHTPNQRMPSNQRMRSKKKTKTKINSNLFAKSCYNGAKFHTKKKKKTWQI